VALQMHRRSLIRQSTDKATRVDAQIPVYQIRNELHCLCCESCNEGGLADLRFGVSNLMRQKGVGGQLEE
jgi:hypothetical protein